MTDEAAILAAILARPLEDTPRTVYADWLDDHGEPDRAEFIRAQVELAHDPRDADATTVQATTWPATARTLGVESRWACGGWLRPAGPRVEVVVRRGFVDELRVATLADLLGGECGRCGGYGLLDRPHRPPVAGAQTAMIEFCSACDAGRTPGIGAAVFKLHPVTRVVVADRGPQGIRHRGGVWHLWYVGGAGTACTLPADLFARLAGGETEWAGEPGHSDGWTMYPTRAAALDALSAALVDHCRGLAGLDPIYADPVA